MIAAANDKAQARQRAAGVRWRLAGRYWRRFRVGFNVWRVPEGFGRLFFLAIAGQPAVIPAANRVV
jgi:hypothetical protein